MTQHSEDDDELLKAQVAKVLLEAEGDSAVAIARDAEEISAIVQQPATRVQAALDALASERVVQKLASEDGKYLHSTRLSSYDIVRLNQLAEAYGVPGGSLGPVTEAIIRSADSLHGTEDERVAVGAIVSAAVSDRSTFEALGSGSEVSADVLARMAKLAGSRQIGLPALLFVDVVLGDIRQHLADCAARRG